MLTYSQAFFKLKDQLQPLYDLNEATAIAHLFLEYITGFNKLERLDKKDTHFNQRQQELYEKSSKDLIKGKPIQYLTNSAWFMGREFLVNENVLIPRPETEELVQWVIESQKSKVKSQNPDSQHPIPNPESQVPRLRILDVGTGSGCIGISLARFLPQSIITCVDISHDALDTLETNKEWVLTTEEKQKRADNIRPLELDFLDEAIRNKELGRYDLIVSNPPYIPFKEKEKLHDNVTRYEPTIALFVPDKDPLVFYRALASFGKGHLRQGGYIYCELDAAHAEECKRLFEKEGYINVELRKDMHGNWRMLSAGKG